jgi:hypothetical protein
MQNALDIVHEWKARLRAGDAANMGDIVDLDGYTEICLGLTDWTTGYDVAARNYRKNMVDPWSNQESSDEAVLEATAAVAIRSRVVATHTGEFLAIPPTGRRIAWDAVSIVSVKYGKVVGQWAQPDLWGIYQQLTRPIDTPAGPEGRDRRRPNRPRA